MTSTPRCVFYFIFFFFLCLLFRCASGEISPSLARLRPRPGRHMSRPGPRCFCLLRLLPPLLPVPACNGYALMIRRDCSGWPSMVRMCLLTEWRGHAGHADRIPSRYTTLSGESVPADEVGDDDSRDSFFVVLPRFFQWADAVTVIRLRRRRDAHSRLHARER